MIFISIAGRTPARYVGWLSSTLESALPKGRIFRDVESIGMSGWKKRSIDEGIPLSDVVLFVIGDRWLTIRREGSDQRRLAIPKTWCGGRSPARLASRQTAGV